ncbi:DUF421 domain-containing protein [Desnuesiella massiliensis]|uniref:DUF421 domain-containing protein n=1 Tax=Desnuesiella massiliensis TaxID=1650662 RepID=UPI0006E4559C|nr:DUF421 domain-containing protein [Desnuesiella massiliensis]
MNEVLVICVRGVISFFTLLIFTRILGKQQIGQITFFDYILGITIGSFAASLTVDLSSAAWPHWVGLLVWIVLGIMLQIVSIKSKSISQYINDEPTIVVYDGKILGDNLKETKYTLTDLLEELRLKDVFDINEVKLTIIERNGHISILKKEDFQNMLNSMNISENNKNLNNELIFNGIIIDHNLSKLDLNRQWLFSELNSQGFDSHVEVFYAFLDSSMKLKIDSYKNKVISSKDIFV